MSNHLYVTRGDGRIQEVNLSTGALISTIRAAADSYLTSLAYDTHTAVWWGILENSPPDFLPTLVRVDMGTGGLTPVGTGIGLSFGRSVSDLAISSTGVLYGMRDGADSQLVRLNKITGLGTLIGSTIVGASGGGFEFAPTTLYLIGENAGENVYTINPTTGAGTLLGTWTFGTFFLVLASSYNSDDDKLYDVSFNRWATFNRTTRVHTVVANMYGGGSDLLALAFGPAASSLPPFIPAPSLDVENGWFVDNMGHDFAVYQSYNPENLHFTKRIRAVEDADWEVSNSAIDANDLPVVGRDVPTDEDNFKPWKHMFKLRLMEEGVETKIMSGPITLTNMAKGRDFVKVGGKDWMHYFEKRSIPFDPAATPNGPFSLSNTFGPTSPPPTGLSYQAAARDIALIVKDVLEFVMAQSNSLPISNTLSAIGITSNFSLSLGDTSKLLAIFDGLAEIWPGFDYRVSYDRAFQIWTPFRFGDPDTTADDGPTGGNIAYTFGDYFNHPVVDCEYTNNGPQATHLFGTGSGLGSTKLGKALGASDIQAGYWRLDSDANFGDEAKTQSLVNSRTRKEFIFQAQEVHEIELTVDPQTVPDFWNVIRPGFAIWLKEDLIQHGIDSAQRVVSMELTKNEQNDQLVKLGLNQIYNTSTHYGVDQA